MEYSMKYYLKIGDNTRILNPGDFFVGADGLNHTYTEAIELSPSDQIAAGVYKLDASSVDYETIYSETNIKLRELEEIKTLKMLRHFPFRGDYYSSSIRDLITINSLLSFAVHNQKGGIDDIGNLMWLNVNVPFFWHTADGNIRNMDIPTLKDFAKSMTEYIMTCNICATILKHEIMNGIPVDSMAAEYWPEDTKTTTENYEYFANKLVNTKYGDGTDVDDSYQSQLDAIASMIQ